MTLTPPELASSGFQYVPVPNEHVTTVIRFLAELTDVSTGTQILGAGLPEQNSDGWTEKELRRLAESGGRLYDVIRAIYDHLAAHPGEWFGTDELAEQTGVELNSVRALPTQTQRSFKVHFDGRTWIGEGEWGTNFTPARRPQMYFSFSREVAERWKRARS